MKILLTGGTGFIGKELMKQIFTHNIYLLTRDIERAKQQLAHVDKGSITYLTSLASLKDANQFRHSRPFLGANGCTTRAYSSESLTHSDVEFFNQRVISS